jgi:hypothetical protein
VTAQLLKTIKPKRKQITCRVNDEAHKALCRYAADLSQKYGRGVTNTEALQRMLVLHGRRRKAK